MLVINGRQITQDALDRDRACVVVVDWLGDDSTFLVIDVTIAGGDAAVLLAGSDDPPDATALAKRIADRLGRPVDLDLQWIPRQQICASSKD